MADHYRYEQLEKSSQDIRVLTLLPGQPRDPIRVKVHTVHLPETSWEAPPYEALSYVWGDKKEEGTKTVTVAPENDDGPDTFIKITENLHACLPYLRYRRRPRTLWIDTICIDQTNLVEKGHAVARMAEIYNFATRVIIWLGPETHNSTDAMKALKWLGSQVIVNWKARSMILANETTQDELDEVIMRELNIILLLLERPWFERLWVQQEAKLASHAQVVCGAISVDWQTFRSALFCLWHLSQRKSLPGEIVERMNRFYILIGKTSFLLNELLFHGRTRKCTDARDRVYALLGLLDPRERKLNIEPDYTSTPAKVYQNVITRYLTNLYRLDPIACCEGLHDSVAGNEMPSWVPDWEYSRKSYPFHWKRHPPTLKAQAHIVDERILMVQGVKMAKVAKAIPLKLTPGSPAQEVVDHIRAIAPQHLWENSPNKEDLIDSFCTTIIAAHFRDRWNPADAQEAIESECRPFLRAILDGSYSEEKHLVEIPTATRYLTLVRMYAACRSFILTEDGSFALGPASTEPGSIICTLVGLKAPVVLKPSKSGIEGEYTLAGECYFDSAVTGQGLLGDLPDKFINVTSYYSDADTFVHSFLDRSTGKFQREEPRLVGKLGEEYRKNYASAEALAEAENAAAVEVMSERGVQLEEFRIV